VDILKWLDVYKMRHLNQFEKVSMALFFKIITVLFAFFTVCSNLMADQKKDIEKYKQSWTAKASALQRQIDLDAPFNQEIFIGTHNSYNSANYSIPFIRYVDPNQTLSIVDQLEMGMRTLEFDAHWFLSRKGKKDILLCHGQDNHLGCSIYDRPIKDGLQELQTWLKANPDEVILLYIERHLDGHEPYLASLLDNYLGRYIYTPDMIRSHHDAPNSCVAIPHSLTKSDILKSKKQLLIVVKGCDGSNPSYQDQKKYPFIWNNYAFSGIGKIPGDPFTFLDTKINSDFKPYPECGTDVIYYQDPAHSSLWRMFEDKTKLSNAVEETRKILPADMQEMLHCDINWISMDMLTTNDPRLRASIWSWAPHYPIDGQGQCALYKNNEGIENADCNKIIDGYACEQEHTHQFQAIAVKGKWQEGESLCQVMAGPKWHFSMPINSSYMQLLKIEVQDQALSNIWVNYRQNAQLQWRTG
jgi:phosphatidylinositol-specific phospholipase C-like protein